MRGLFINELIKLKRSRMIKGVFIVFMCFCLMVVFIDMGAPATFGFTAPFTWLSCNGAAGFFLYGLIVADMIAREFEQGVIHNALGRGVGKSKFFFVKLITLFAVSVVMYLSCMGIFTAASSMKEGFDPKGQVYANYALKVLVFNTGAVIAILSCVALYMFLAYLLRNAALTFGIAVAATIVDLLGWYPGPMTAAWKTIDFFLEDAVLTREFALIFVPCIFILFVSVVGAYALFRLRDLK